MDFGAIRPLKLPWSSQAHCVAQASLNTLLRVASRTAPRTSGTSHGPGQAASHRPMLRPSERAKRRGLGASSFGRWAQEGRKKGGAAFQDFRGAHGGFLGDVAAKDLQVHGARLSRVCDKRRAKHTKATSPPHGKVHLKVLPAASPIVPAPSGNLLF